MWKRIGITYFMDHGINLAGHAQDENKNEKGQNFQKYQNVPTEQWYASFCEFFISDLLTESQ